MEKDCALDRLKIFVCVTSSLKDAHLRSIPTLHPRQNTTTFIFFRSKVSHEGILHCARNYSLSLLSERIKLFSFSKIYEGKGERVSTLLRLQLFLNSFYFFFIFFTFFHESRFNKRLFVQSETLEDSCRIFLRNPFPLCLL